jgi:hypothetical protein
MPSRGEGGMGTDLGMVPLILLSQVLDRRNLRNRWQLQQTEFGVMQTPLFQAVWRLVRIPPRNPVLTSFHVLNQ